MTYKRLLVSLHFPAKAGGVGTQIGGQLWALFLADGGALINQGHPEMDLWNVWVGKPSILRGEDVRTWWVEPQWLP